MHLGPGPDDFEGRLDFSIVDHLDSPSFRQLPLHTAVWPWTLIVLTSAKQTRRLQIKFLVDMDAQHHDACVAGRVWFFEQSWRRLDQILGRADGRCQHLNIHFNLDVKRV